MSDWRGGCSWHWIWKKKNVQKYARLVGMVPVCRSFCFSSFPFTRVFLWIVGISCICSGAYSLPLVASDALETFCFCIRVLLWPRRICRFLPFVVVSLCWWNVKDVLTSICVTNWYIKRKRTWHTRDLRARQWIYIARRQIYFCVILITTKICFSAVNNHELCIMLR